MNRKSERARRPIQDTTSPKRGFLQRKKQGLVVNLRSVDLNTTYGYFGYGKHVSTFNKRDFTCDKCLCRSREFTIPVKRLINITFYLLSVYRPLKSSRVSDSSHRQDYDDKNFLTSAMLL